MARVKPDSLSLSLSPAVLVIGVHAILGLSVPQLHGLVVSARHNESAVWRKLGTSHPVAVATQGALELLPVDRPQLGGEQRERGGGGGGGDEYVSICWATTVIPWGSPGNTTTNTAHSPTAQHTLCTLIVLSSEAVSSEWPSLAKSTHLMEAV